MKLESTMHKLKDIRGRRITGYRARFAGLSADAGTPQEAESKLAMEIQKECEDHHTSVSSVAGYVVVVSWHLHGWQYQIIETQDCRQNKVKSHWSGCSADSQREAEQRALMGIAERILFKNWQTTGEPNELELALGLVDDNGRKELLRNLEWQKKYRESFAVAREYGMNENQADLYAREAPGVQLPAEKPVQAVLL